MSDARIGSAAAEAANGKSPALPEGGNAAAAAEGVQSTRSSGAANAARPAITGPCYDWSQEKDTEEVACGNNREPRRRKGRKADIAVEKRVECTEVDLRATMTEGAFCDPTLGWTL